MGSITKTTPKPLIPIHGHPILWYILMTLRKHGIKNLVFPLGYKGEMLENYVKKTFADSDFVIHFANTGIESSIAERINMIADIIPEDADFLLLNSDTIFDFDINAMLELHRKSNALATFSTVEIISSWGLLHKRNNTLAGFSRERKAHYLASKDDHELRGYIYSGIGFINKQALSLIDLKNCHDFEQDLYSKIIEMGRGAHYEIEGSWFAIDTPKDLQIINQLTGDKNNRGKIVHSIQKKLSKTTRKKKAKPVKKTAKKKVKPKKKK